jgi:ComF family protein
MIRTLIHRLGSDFLGLIAPGLCPACDEPLGDEDRYYCSACRVSLEPAPFPDDLYTELIGNVSRDELAIDALGALYRFAHDTPVQRLIHALKYRGCYQLGVEMGGELGAALMMFCEFQGMETIVPVPLHHARRRERGYNQAEAIARGISTAMGGIPVERALVRTRYTTSQTTLDAKKRKLNIAQAFRATKGSIRGKRILLCDDVCTTGATLNACAEQLLAAGARTVTAATVAKDIPDREEFSFELFAM